VNVPSSVPIHASELYSRNILSLLDHLIADGDITLDFEDQITADACLTHQREVRHPGVREALSKESGA
jgi:NAD(P) transhydrogenase subunit alpha